MVNMSAKFDKTIGNGLVAIMFTRSTLGLTDTQQRYYITIATCCAGIKMCECHEHREETGKKRKFSDLYTPSPGLKHPPFRLW